MQPATTHQSLRRGRAPASCPLAWPRTRAARRRARRVGLGDSGNFVNTAMFSGKGPPAASLFGAGAPSGFHGSPAAGAASVGSSFLPASASQTYNQISGIAGSGAGLASASGLFAGASGIMGTIGAALPWVGAGLAVGGVALNLLKCGTVGQVGCQKRDDAGIMEQAMAAMRQIVWECEQGQLDAASGKGQIQAIAQQAAASFHRQENLDYPNNTWDSCGAWLSKGPGCGQQICPGTSIPPNSIAATVGCGQTMSWNQMVALLMSACDQAAASAAKRQQVQATPVKPGSPIQLTGTAAAAASAAAPKKNGSWLLPLAVAGGAAMMLL